jgi:hypothetical protein
MQQELMLSQSTAPTSALQPQPLAPKLQTPTKLEALKQELARLRATFGRFQSPVNNFIEPSGGDRMAMTS